MNKYRLTIADDGEVVYQATANFCSLLKPEGVSYERMAGLDWLYEVWVPTPHPVSLVPYWKTLARDEVAKLQADGN